MTTSTQPVNVTRDRPTWLIYLILATFATYLYGLSSAVTMIRDDLGLSDTQAGMHGTGMAIGAVISGLSLPMITARFGRRAATWAGIAGMNVGMLIVVFAHSLPFTLLGYTIASGTAAITLYVVMAVLSDHHGAAGAAVISEANAVGVLAGIPASFAFSLLADSVFGWRAALFLPVICSVALAITMGRVWIPPTEPSGPVGASNLKVPYGWRFHVAGVVLLCVVAVEFSFNMWAADLLAQRTGLSVATAATGLTAMLIGMAIGRFGGGRLTLRYPVSSVLIGALAVAFAGWALFWAAAITVLAYAGLVLAGIGIGLHFPLAISQLIKASGGRPDAASGAASVWAGVGSGVGPLVLGALGDGFGTHTAFLLAPALMGLAAGAVLSSRSPSPGSSPDPVSATGR